MGILKDFLVGDGLSFRRAVPLNTPLSHSVPIQHSASQGSESIRKLPVVRKCLGYIADTINEAEPRIVDVKGKVIYGPRELPEWLSNPSSEYVFEELVHQAVWSLFVNGYLRLLASTRPNGVPMFCYVGTTGVVSYTISNGELIYLDYSSYGYGSNTIVANSISYRRRLALPGKPLGLGEFEPAKDLIETALFAQDVVNRFFGKSMFVDLVFSHDGEYVANAGKELIIQLAQQHAGPRNAFRPLVSDRKWRIDRVRDSNQANQLVEIIGMVNTAISTQVFGIDPLVFSLSTQSSSASSLTYQNASNLRSQVWLQAIKPIARLIAGCFTDYLPKGQFFEFSAHDLLRGSPSDRGQLVQAMALAGKHYGSPLFFPEEIREVLSYYGPAPKALPVSNDMKGTANGVD